MTNSTSHSQKRTTSPAATPRARLSGQLLRPTGAIDPDRIRIQRESELRQVISKDPEVESWCSEFGAEIREQQWAYRRHHLASSVRITPRISPKLNQRFGCVRQILGNELKVELYVEHSAEIGASCMALPDSSLLVTLTSGAAEKLAPSEQLFVMGHEVGHYLLGHHEWPVGAMLAPRAEVDQGMSPRLALQLLSWSRCCEISADRFGLLCAQREDVLARAFLKLASGLPSSLLGSGEDYLSQLDEWLEHRTDDEGSAATHPLHAIRIYSGQSFWRSTYLDEIFGPCLEMPADHSAEAADLVALEQLAVMDPDPVALEKNEHAGLVREFLAYAGVMVVASDGEVDPREVPALLSIADPDHVGRALELIRLDRLDEVGSEGGRRATILRCSAPRDVSERALMQLLVLAYVDGHLAQLELETINCFADALGYSSIIVNLIIDQLQRGNWEE